MSTRTYSGDPVALAKAAAARRPGRPAAGVDGIKVRSYPKVRIEPRLLETLRQLAKDAGEPVHRTLGRVLDRGLQA